MNILIAGNPDNVRNYQAALAAAGFQSVCAPDALSSSGWDGLLLPGGGDIDPAFFHQPVQGSLHIDRTLDLKQFRLLDSFVKAEKPVLGICKGLQLINVYFGGTLIQHLPTAASHEYLNGDQFHQTWTARGSFLEALYGSSFITNSAHHQGAGKLGIGLRVIQETADFVPEAIIHTTLPVIALQWHPERLCLSYARAGAADGLKLFTYWHSQLKQRSTHA